MITLDTVPFSMQNKPMRCLAVLLLCGAAAAQTGPAFDVASVKALPKEVGEMATKPTLTARRLVWQTDLYYLSAFAWNIPFQRVNGIHSRQIVRIEATTNHDATVDEMRQMTRTLLATRFNQKAHILSQDVEGAALIFGERWTQGEESRVFSRRRALRLRNHAR